MTVLKLKADPTFKAKVRIPVPGKPDAEIEFEFKHRTKDELTSYMDGIQNRPDVDIVMETVVSWGFADAYTRENVEMLVQNYHAAGGAISKTYINELMGLRLGN